MLGTAPKVLAKTVEPYLLRSGLIVKDDQGHRNLTEIGQQHLSSLRPQIV
jgi:Holliday junction resolvasome RuvABC ATP-dependent DNA helicase subunit